MLLNAIGAKVATGVDRDQARREVFQFYPALVDSRPTDPAAVGRTIKAGSKWSPLRDRQAAPPSPALARRDLGQSDTGHAPASLPSKAMAGRPWVWNSRFSASPTSCSSVLSLWAASMRSWRFTRGLK